MPFQIHSTLPVLRTRLEGCLENLQASGFSERTLKKRWATFKALVRWLEQERISDADALAEDNIDAFLGRIPETRKEHRRIEAAGIRRLRAYLDAEIGSTKEYSSTTLSASERIIQEYTAYLKQERGLAERSIGTYADSLRGTLDEFVREYGSFCPAQLDVAAVRAVLLIRISKLSTSGSRRFVATLRPFLRFLFQKGHTKLDLSVSVPTFRASRHRIPGFLLPEQVETVLSAPDRAKPTGKRDFAVLLLLARLGLRAFEVVSLELDDLRWRDGKLIVRGKGRVFESLPLLSEIGEAVAEYLQDGRPETTSRRVFIRTYAPHVGLSGPAAVGHIVRRALSLAGVKPSGRGAAHLFRHSLATQMVRNGATITEIAQILRHRAEGTTEIYTQVAFESLRGVARSWPVPVGAS